MDRHELALRLSATFANEAEERIESLSLDVLALEEQPGDVERLKSIFRTAHTLKGAARAAGVSLVEEAFHALETRIAEVQHGKRPIDEHDLAFLFSAVDAMKEVIGLLRSGGDVTKSELPTLVRALKENAPARRAPPAPPRAAEREEPPARRFAEENVRIDRRRLDGLLAAVGELVVEKARMEHNSNELGALADELSAFADRLSTTGRVLRVPVDRDGVSPGVGEALRGMDAAARRLARRTSQLASSGRRDVRRIGAAVADVMDQTHDLRVRPLADLQEPLARTVRDLARAGGKEVRLELEGMEVEADRAVLDAMRDALMQLVRNAVDHGIELRGERARRGKPEAGTVRIHAALVQDRLTVTVKDDGGGVDVPRVRALLAKRGADVPADDAEVVRSLFAGGLSTRARATATSGRGVGLDVVREVADRLRGSVDMESRPGAGTSVRIECPPTLATLRVVLVGIGQYVLGIPTSNVRRLVRVRVGEVRRADGHPVLTTDDGPVALASLARLLGPPLVERPVGDVVHVIFLAHGSSRLAVTVDELMAESEVLVRPIERDGMRVRSVTGASVLGDGRLATILDVSALLAERSPEAGAATLRAAPTNEVGTAPHVLVVDDSITTRTLEASVLETAGYRVSTAVDGADAWRIIQERGCDLVVSDVDMPRMDGFDLCRAIRSSKRFRELPVVLVTALESQEDRRRGLDVGADAYIGKSGFDQEQLMETINRLIG